jgi:putative membrane protein
LEEFPVHGERKRVFRPGILQAIVVVAWMLAFGWLGRGSGDDALLGRFIRSDYWWLVYIGIGILIALAASLMVRPPRQSGVNVLRRVLQIGILLLPLFYLPLAVTSELSTDAAEKRSLFTPRVAVSRPRTPRQVNPQQWRQGQQMRQTQMTVAVASKPAPTPVKRAKPGLLDLVTDPEDFEGADVTLLGIVHRDKRLAANSFFCYRLVMVCCAADATPAGVIVKWPSSAKLKTGAWVKVHGKVTFTTFEGSDYPAISAVSVEKTRPPKNRFLIPK